MKENLTCITIHGNFKSVMSTPEVRNLHESINCLYNYSYYVKWTYFIFTLILAGGSDQLTSRLLASTAEFQKRIMVDMLIQETISWTRVLRPCTVRLAMESTN